MCRLGPPFTVLLYQTGSRHRAARAARAARERERERERELLVLAPHGVADGVVMGLLGGADASPPILSLVWFARAEDVGTNRGWAQVTSDRSPSIPLREFPFFTNGLVGCSLFSRFLPTPSWKSWSTVKISIPGGALRWCRKAARFQWFRVGFGEVRPFGCECRKTGPIIAGNGVGCVQSASAVGPR